MRFIDEAAKRSAARAEREREGILALELSEHAPLDLASALSSPELSFICELKRASPTLGPIKDADPVKVSRAYEAAGAAAISVLTEPASFGGSMEDLAAVRKTVDIPLIRKDFLTDPVQIRQARAYGADAVLLIIGILGDRLAQMLAETSSYGMQALVEVHTGEELEIAISSGAKIIGVNNRDLASLEIDLGVCERLLPKIPQGIIAVAESGVKGAEDAARMREAGADAVLVGSSLMQAQDPGAKLTELSAGAR